MIEDRELLQEQLEYIRQRIEVMQNYVSRELDELLDHEISAERYLVKNQHNLHLIDNMLKVILEMDNEKV